MLKFTYKKIDGEETWTYKTKSHKFTVNLYNEHLSLTVYNKSGYQQFNLKNLVAVSCFIELNYDV